MGFKMKIVDKEEWKAIAAAVSQGIDGNLEAITEKSKFDHTTGECDVDMAELPVLIRRLRDYDAGEYLADDIESVLAESD